MTSRNSLGAIVLARFSGRSVVTAGEGGGGAADSEATEVPHFAQKRPVTSEPQFGQVVMLLLLLTAQLFIDFSLAEASVSRYLFDGVHP